jgi:predicted RNase H-like HicB family nuclease
MKIHVYFDNTDSIYIAEVPELPGCMAHGLTYKDALKHDETAI